MRIENLSLARRFMGKFRRRPAADYECMFEPAPDGNGLQLLFFVPRVAMEIRILVPAGVSSRVQDVLSGARGEEQSLEFTLERIQTQHGLVLEVRPQPLVETSRLVIQITPTDGTDYGLHVLLQKKRYRDGKLFEHALVQASQRMLAEAISLFTQYENLSHESPFASYYLTDLHLQQGHLQDADRHALEGCARAQFDFLSDKYREVQQALDPTPVEEIRDLKKQARQWDIGVQHGAVVLEMKREALLGLGHEHHAEKRREIIEIRRASAARMLRQLSYLFSAGRETVVHSSCRVIRDNGDIEELSQEHITITDHQSNNPFIAIENEKELIWILPDLAPGDIVESSLHLVCRDQHINDQAHPFVVMQPCHPFFPTAHSHFIARAPAQYPLRFSTRNLSSEVERVAGSDGEYRYELDIEHWIPFKQTGFEYESAFLNPVIAVTRDGPTWADVARSALENTLGEHPESELPAKLQAIVDGQPDAKSRLEHSFYWVRDNIKYASMLSAKRRIGDSGRAEKIVETGVGDCEDKSYLLHLVCNALDLPNNFALVSSKRGILVEDLPAEQFDHIFVRASVDGQQIWMDAADGFSAFGSAPAARQGLPALLLDEAGSLVTVPEDDPAQNRIEICEVFDNWSGDRLRGRFDLKAYGINGRVADEGFKSASLAIDDPARAGETSLRQYLLGGIFETHAQESQATHSQLFHVSGTHARGPVLRMGNGGSEIGSLSWAIPTLPTGFWRTLDLDRLFVVGVLMSVRIDVHLEAEVFETLRDLSTLDSVENEFCSITEHVERGSSSCRIRRELVFKRRFVEGPALAHVTSSLEQAEKALSMVVGFHGREARATG